MMPIERSVPAMVKLPSPNSMSPAEASSTKPATACPFRYLRGGFDDRGAARIHRARTAGAAAREQFVAVALQQPDLLERDAELRRQHLRERRGVALAVIERAGNDGDVAIRLEADAAHFLVRRRGDFEIAADAEAAQLAALLGCRACAP